MSFSSDVKNEIILKDYINEKSALSELVAIVCFGGKLRKVDGKYVLSFVTENPRIARRIYSLLKGTLTVNSRIKIRKNSVNAFYDVVVDNQDEIENVYKSLYLISKEETLDNFLNYHISKKFTTTREVTRSVIRGAFLVGGSVMDPYNTYHLEFTTSRFGVANDFMEILSGMGISAKLVMRKSKCVMYYKNSEDITDVLTILGSVNALMEYHNAKIVKEMRNNVNRTVNCETANLNKTVDASVEQVKAIEKLMETGKFNSLPDNLKEIANLRLEYREHSLKELGEMLSTPIGKSGVNHRLRKIIEIASKI